MELIRNSQRQSKMLVQRVCTSLSFPWSTNGHNAIRNQFYFCSILTSFVHCIVGQSCPSTAQTSMFQYVKQQSLQLMYHTDSAKYTKPLDRDQPTIQTACLQLTYLVYFYRCIISFYCSETRETRLPASQQWWQSCCHKLWKANKPKTAKMGQQHL